VSISSYASLPSIVNTLVSCHIGESASRPLVNFGVLNDNLIKGLISCVK
jgi:hypothetical protein